MSFDSFNRLNYFFHLLTRASLKEKAGQTFSIRKKRRTYEAFNINFRLLKERSYTYDELEGMADGHWHKSCFEIYKKAPLKDLILGKSVPLYNDPKLFWRVWGGHLFEFLASLILKNEENMLIMSGFGLSRDEKKAVAEELGLLDIVSELGKEFGKSFGSVNAFNQITDKVKKHPLLKELQEGKDKYYVQISKLRWKKFQKHCLDSNKYALEIGSEELEVLKSCVKDSFPLDLLVFTPQGSWLQRSFYLIEVKATKSRITLKQLLSRLERKFINEYSSKAGILIMYFCIEPENVNLEYCKPF